VPRRASSHLVVTMTPGSDNGYGGHHPQRRLPNGQQQQHMQQQLEPQNHFQNQVGLQHAQMMAQHQQQYRTDEVDVIMDMALEHLEGFPEQDQPQHEQQNAHQHQRQQQQYHDPHQHQNENQLKHTEDDNAHSDSDDKDSSDSDDNEYQTQDVEKDTDNDSSHKSESDVDVVEPVQVQRQNKRDQNTSPPGQMGKRQRVSHGGGNGADDVTILPTETEEQRKFSSAWYEYEAVYKNHQQMKEKAGMFEKAKQNLEDTTERVLDELLQDQSQEWNKMYAFLVDYYKKRGHSKASRVKVTAEELKEEPHLEKLGMWVYKQRVAYRNARDEPEKYPPFEYYKVKALERLDMVWEVKYEKWMQRFDELKAFKAKYGDFDVPNVKLGGGPGLKNGEPVDPFLSRWVKCQIGQYVRLKKGVDPSQVNIDQNRIDMMEAVGFKFEKGLDKWWFKRFEDAKLTIYAN
jgi:hypothetical protein